MELKFYPGLIVSVCVCVCACVCVHISIYTQNCMSNREQLKSVGPLGLIGTPSVPLSSLQCRFPFLMDHKSIHLLIPHVLREKKRSRTLHISHPGYSNVIRVSDGSVEVSFFFFFFWLKNTDTLFVQVKKISLSHIRTDSFYHQAWGSTLSAPYHSFSSFLKKKNSKSKPSLSLILNILINSTLTVTVRKLWLKRNMSYFVLNLLPVCTLVSPKVVGKTCRSKYYF